MHRITHPGTQGGPGYQSGLDMAAHYAMRGRASSKRLTVWHVPVGGVGRGIGPGNPAYAVAVAKALEEGPLGGARAEWTDERGRWTVQEA